MKRKEEKAYSSDKEYRVLRWALRSITVATITEVRIKAIILYSGRGRLTFSFGTMSITSFYRKVSRLFKKKERKRRERTAGISEGAEVSCDETGCEAGTDSG